MPESTWSVLLKHTPTGPAECKFLIICIGTKSIMRARLYSNCRSVYAPCRNISFVYIILEDHRIFAQLGIPADSILLNNTNMTTQIAPTITANTTVTPAPEVNNTLIWRSTPTTSNTTLQFDNKTGEAEPIGGNK